MPLNPDTLILPEETEILLSALKLTDGKVEQLLPLLALLQTETGERSELGEALLNALLRIQSELNAFQILRQDLEAHIATLTSTLNALQNEDRESLRMIREMHGALMVPVKD
ncbi:hypothetical protein JMM61_14150 [Rhodovulum sulfidophilum]|uniref:hypothetical protein n=1 Tax=Rhodovulum sulfidophilum TaxID=35806 RepID=UPI001928282B|nr:hypothetical protein [Rhodovulum sulfidophilum]MBL3586519.1 hypothetical protein [Rhodovulum sulfidophilum]MCE8439826.1 hypothetical protein [Rhodovulum sulfidophilum]MCE8472311.1 hypothetical protein [Rhodovulum sulfidophilum]